MNITGEYVFDAPQEMVWDAVRDPDVLGSILPGGEGIAEVGENEYEGKLRIKVGPVQGTFNGKIKLENMVVPESYDIKVDGKGAPGFVKAKGALALSPNGTQTHMAYNGTAQVGGRIASVGQRLLDASAKSIIRQSLEALNAYLQVQQAAAEPAAAKPAAETPAAPEAPAAETPEAPEAPAAPSPQLNGLHAASPPTPEYVPPTQTELAFNIARDVYEDLVPEAWRPVVTSVLTTLITLFILRLFGGRRR